MERNRLEFFAPLAQHFGSGRSDSSLVDSLAIMVIFGAIASLLANETPTIKPLNERQLNFLQRKRLTKHLCDGIAKADVQTSCVICQSEFVDLLEEGEGDAAELCILPCHHVFCWECAHRWLSANVTCPMCRADVSSEVESAIYELSLPSWWTEFDERNYFSDLFTEMESKHDSIEPETKEEKKEEKATTPSPPPMLAEVDGDGSIAGGRSLLDSFMHTPIPPSGPPSNRFRRSEISSAVIPAQGGGFNAVRQLRRVSDGRGRTPSTPDHDVDC
ncbi:Zinc finger, C3HC4 type (RING finger)/Ring finger domain/RING-type zinc-finger/zinc-RING finger domain containing protein, putative [Angomonas deanei]|uniref:Zinc finger, C3HC4 type (RING finger)/Ring finger domain/RING-type zinc-finger/zinc-RING finger domain containing protein, putative n=1 Tax=Angomonas deanei TaxID=59799 RepID=A0A7G2CPZ3_9TRYP|nr:Zinc finger, C3HC4 type (RING finger)/Ring finger domain/RING-type zinc-finger/zinc-RING finger domain containing protein, putative [Angomonas deanei]